MTTPNIKDTNAVAGCHPGTASQEEIKNKISISVDTNKSIESVGSKIISTMDWHMSAMADTLASPKYAIDSNVSFLGGGALAIDRFSGKLLFSSLKNEEGRGALELNQGGSSFYSNLNSTTLGSLNIETVDGYILNPLSSVFPSTNFSPTKPWIKKLIPNFSTQTLVTIGILELVSRTLKNVLRPTQAEDFTSKSDMDMATIIVDNQIIEDQIYGGF